MSTWWHLRRRRLLRPAPPASGRFATRIDSAPHGWEPLNPSASQQLIQRADNTLLATADSAARLVSRRVLFRRIGQAALVVGLGASGVLWRPRTADAYAAIYSYCDPFGDPPTGPCGPTGLCAPGDCNSGNCANADKRRAWSGSTCCSGCTGTQNCWQENCCGVTGWNHHMKCCDCCTDSGSVGTTCTTCTGISRHKCSCRATDGAAC